MALKFGLFSQGGLEQETGDLKERWGQGGSNVINYYEDDVEDETIYTVTANKSLFVKSVIVYFNGEGESLFRDGGSSGSHKFNVKGTNESITVTFDVPIKFTSDIYVTYGGSGTNVDVSFSGWEE